MKIVNTFGGKVLVYRAGWWNAYTAVLEAAAARYKSSSLLPATNFARVVKQAKTLLLERRDFVGSNPSLRTKL